MRATVVLNLANNESHHFFSKRLKNNDTLYESAIRKINLLLKKSIDYNACALLKVIELDEKIKKSTDYLFDELDKFEGQLEKRQFPGAKKVTFITKPSPDISCSNALNVSLIEWIEVFDKLISTLKLLQLSGCFESIDAFYSVKRRYQKHANKLLSAISLSSCASMPNESIKEVIASTDDYEWQRLYDALQSSYAPGFSPSLRNQLLYQLKQKMIRQEESSNTEQVIKKESSV